MPRYYLNVENGFGFVEDEEGQEFTGLEEAKAAAIEGARSLMSTEVMDGKIDLRGRIDVLDERHVLAISIAFSDIVAVLRGELPSRESGV